MWGILAVALVGSAEELRVGEAVFAFDSRGRSSELRFSDGSVWRGTAGEAVFGLEVGERRLAPVSVQQKDGEVEVRFEEGTVARLAVQPGQGFTMFRLASLDLHSSATRLTWMRLPVPEGAQVSDTLNACFHQGRGVAVMAGEPDVHAFPSQAGRRVAGSLNAETLQRFGLERASFGVIACPQAQFFGAVERFEAAAGIGAPRLGGAWNKRSQAVCESYLFLTDFSEHQFDTALRLARQGGFRRVLLGQESWCSGTGHYEVNRSHFPGGLPSLVRTAQRFREAGIDFGLHFLAASIYPPDRYLTPVPDPRLLKGARASLAADLDEITTTIPVQEPPSEFPAEDGGYTGDGTVLQIGDELVAYDSLTTSPPFGFLNCRRGHLGTHAASHARGDSVRHLVRAYGYHMYDMDTSLLDEVTSNFASVANACAAGMVYFDGAERLQGDHWRYNARLVKAFHDHLERKDVLLQASSFSHYSWHLLARTASADGHGDLKGYLEQRSPFFAVAERDGIPLDIGWYYGYDRSATPDMYEYILGTTIGYGASMSYQVSVRAAVAHPFTWEILDLISRYEKLRTSGQVPESVRERLRVDKSLAGLPPEAPNRPNAARRDYRLVGESGREAFQRVVYEPWQETGDPSREMSWQTHVTTGPARLGLQLQALNGPWLRPGDAYTSQTARLLEGFEDLAAWRTAGQRKLAGTTLDGVTQTLTLLQDGAREGRSCAVYTASSTRADALGWSYVPRQFDPPLDLSASAGVGLWLRGDGHGGQFKLQLCDAKEAVDHYVTNDYEGWHYQQFARSPKDKIDYHAIRQLGIYFNGIPAHTEVTCAVDGVKALSAVDTASVQGVWMEVGGRRIEWAGAVGEGQYLFIWPGEPVSLYGLPLLEPARMRETGPVLELPEGQHTVRFGCAKESMLPLRVRLTLQPPERHPAR